MGAYAGPEINEDGLVLALDAANLKGYDKYENLFTYSGFPQSSNTTVPTGWNGWNPATFLKSQTLSPNEVDYGVFHGAINQNGGGIRKDLTGLSANTTYTISFWGKRITESELTYFTNNNGRGTTTGTADGAQNVAWFVATKCVVNVGNLNGTGASGGKSFTLSETWTKFSTQLTTDSAGSIRIIISNNVSDVGTGNEDGGGTWMIWGAQLEIGSSVTDYYATTSTTKIRGTSWSDLSGNGNNGTLVNGVGYVGTNGGSLSFDGVNDYVGAGNLGSFYTQGTISYWMYSTAVENYRNPFSTHYLGLNAGIRFEQYTTASPHGGFNVVIGNDDGSYSFYDYSPSSVLSSNTWYNVVLVWNTTSSNVKGYLNGIEKFSSSHTLWATTLPSISIGSGFSGSRYFKGNISSTKIYNRALTASEIQQNFNALRGRYGI